MQKRMDIRELNDIGNHIYCPEGDRLELTDYAVKEEENSVLNYD